MADDLIQLGGSASNSTASIEEEKSEEKVEKECDEGKPVKFNLILGKKAALSVSSLDSYASTDGESLLEELLGDIRRSRTASLASTPTFASSECETDGVRDCGRSEAELKGMGVL